MKDRTDVLVLGIGNVLWADEGFGVRAVEALHAAWVFPPEVRADGRRHPRASSLFEDVCQRQPRAGLRCGGLRPARRHAARCCAGDEVPVWGAQRISPHQNGFNDVLALAQIGGRAPDHITRHRRAADHAGRLRRQPAARGQGAPARGRGAGGAGAHRLGVCARAARARQCLRTAERPVAVAGGLRSGSPVGRRGLPRRRTRACMALSAAPAQES